MSVEIARVREEHIVGCHAALDVVARERKYLSFLEAPPIESSRQFIGRSIANGHPHFVALERDRVVGWCDVTPRAWTGCGTTSWSLFFRTEAWPPSQNGSQGSSAVRQGRQPARTSP